MKVRGDPVKITTFIKFKNFSKNTAQGTSCIPSILEIFIRLPIWNVMVWKIFFFNNLIIVVLLRRKLTRLNQVRKLCSDTSRHQKNWELRGLLNFYVRIFLLKNTPMQKLHSFRLWRSILMNPKCWKSTRLELMFM